LDDGNITWVFDVADPKLRRINPNCGCDLIHEGFARKVDLWSNRVTKVRRAQRRGPIEQWRYGLPPGAFRSKLVRLGRHTERRLRFQAHARELPGESVLRATLVASYVEAREGFAGELVSDDLAVRIERSSGFVDGGRTLRIPSGALFTRILKPNRLTNRFR
jgi:hypothetical protein